jgi:hypothetical protein
MQWPMHNVNKMNTKECLINDLPFQVKTVPRVGEQPARTATSTSTSTGVVTSNKIVVRPKERQVCLPLRNLLKKDRGSN